MMNPFEVIEAKFESAKADFIQASEAKMAEAKVELVHQLHVELMREGAIMTLSRLATLDPERAADYLAAVKVIE